MILLRLVARAVVVVLAAAALLLVLGAGILATVAWALLRASASAPVPKRG